MPITQDQITQARAILSSFDEETRNKIKSKMTSLSSDKQEVVIGRLISSQKSQAPQTQAVQPRAVQQRSPVSDISNIVSPLTDPLSIVRGTAGIESMSQLSELIRQRGGQTPPIQNIVQKFSDKPFDILQQIPKDLESRLPELVQDKPILLGRTVNEVTNIVRNTSPRDIAQFVGNEFVDPRSIATLLAPGLAGSRASRLAKVSKLRGKAEKITTEVLQPSQKKLADAIDQGRQLDAVREGTNIITRAKTYGQLREQIRTVTKTLFDKRNSILRAKNRPVSDSYLQPLRDLIAQSKQSGQFTKAEIKQMVDVFKRERSYINRNKLDLIKAQARKELLQDQTETLLVKRQGGETTVTQPARKQALDAIRKGLADDINSTDPLIAATNKRYEGLRVAKRLAAERQAEAAKIVPENIIQRTLGHITPSFLWTAAGAIRSVAKQARSLTRRTGKISGLRTRAEGIEASLSGRQPSLTSVIGGQLVAKNLIDRLLEAREVN